MYLIFTYILICIIHTLFKPKNIYYKHISPIKVSALALDPSGARLVTGSYDFDVKLWDFAGMDPSLKSFRSLRPCEWSVIFNLKVKKKKGLFLEV